MNGKIQHAHIERQAVVYLRQSTLKQVYEHRESTTRQYALKERAIADWYRLLELCGLAHVAIVDEHAVYDPCQYDDRLLLGLKGTRKGIYSA